MATERAVLTVSALAVTGILVAGCGPSNISPSPSTRAAASSAAARARAVASSTVVQGDKDDAVNNILTPCIQKASGLSSLKSCIEGKLPAPARQQAVKCLAIAGLHGGRNSVGGPAGQACIAAALGGPSAPPSAPGNATLAPSLHATPASTIVVHPATPGQQPVTTIETAGQATPASTAKVAYWKPNPWERVQQLIDSAITCGHIAVPCAVVVYYIVTQNGLVKPYWDHLFPLLPYLVEDLFRHAHHGLDPNHMVQWGWWQNWRHILFRGGLEGVYGSAAVKLFLTNPLRHYKRTDPDRADRWMLRLRLPNRFQGRPTSAAQYALAPVSILLACAPGMAIGCLVFFGGPVLLHAVHAFWDVHALGQLPGTSVWDQYQNLWRADWSSKAIGILGFVLFGNRMITKVGGDMLKNLACRKAYKYQAYEGRPVRQWLLGRPRWFYPPIFKRLWEQAIQVPQAQHGNKTRLVTFASMPLVLAAAVWGTHILLAAKG